MVSIFNDPGLRRKLIPCLADARVGNAYRWETAERLAEVRTPALQKRFQPGNGFGKILAPKTNPEVVGLVLEKGAGQQ
jgi:hypothetical protein